MESPVIDLNYFYDLDYENKTCVDCHAAMPKYVSINNAIIICQGCALKHKALGYNISYIREVKSEWDQYLLAYLYRGGNGRFIRLLREFEIEDFAIESKYITKAAEYHRLVIKSEVLAEEPPMPLFKDQGMEYCNMTESYFPEFENYQLYTGEAQPNQDGLPKKILYGSLKTVSKGIGTVYNRLNQNDIKEKVGYGSELTYNALKYAGGYLYQQSKPLMRFMSKKATEGIGYIYQQMKENLVEDDIITNENDTNDYINVSRKSAEKPQPKKIRPKSIEKEKPRKSSIEITKDRRSTSIGKEQMNYNNNNNDDIFNQVQVPQPIVPLPIPAYSDKDDKQEGPYQFNDNTNISQSITINNDEYIHLQSPPNLIFSKNINYPSYEDIIKNTNTNIMINQNIINDYPESTTDQYNNNIFVPIDDITDINQYKSQTSNTDTHQ